MAQQERIKIPRASDRSVVDFFREVGAPHGVTHLSVSAHGSVALGNVDLGVEPSDDFAVLLDLDSALITSASFMIGGLAVGYQRGGAVPAEHKSPIFDEVTLSFNPQQGDLPNSERLKIVEQANSMLHGFEPGQQIDSGVSPEQGSLLAIHQSNLQRLEKLNEDLIRQGIEYRESLDERFQEKFDEHDKEYMAKREGLDLEYKAKHDALEEERSRLEVERRAIDDRDNTHVRRELRKELLEEVKDRSAIFSLTKGTQKLRWPIHLACIVFFGISAYFAYIYSTELFEYVQRSTVSVVTTIILSSKPLGFTFAAVATAIFYIRWLNRWFDQHADAEFRLKQFQLDIDRASWVVETVLEMKSAKDVIPTALLESISKNLFEYESKNKDDQLHPADKLASALLGTASNVNVKAGDTEISFTGKDLKKKMKKENQE